jgi:hypothetical protein
LRQKGVNWPRLLSRHPFEAVDIAKNRDDHGQQPSESSFPGDDCWRLPDEGEFIVLLEPSGYGKTTTLRMIAGLEVATCGAIRFGEIPREGADVAERPGSLGTRYEGEGLLARGLIPCGAAKLEGHDGGRDPRSTSGQGTDGQHRCPRRRLRARLAGVVPPARDRESACFPSTGAEPAVPFETN